MNNEEQRIRRIVVALDASEEAAAALEAAAELAARLQAEVMGLFVEDINLLRLAALPFARELGYGSSRSRELDPAHMERTLRARAEAMKQHLARCAEQARIHWSFQVRRGDILEELLATTMAADLVVVGGFGRAIVDPRQDALPRQVLARCHSRCHCAVLRPSRRSRLDRPVVLYYDGSASCRRALHLAVRLAGDQEQRLHVLLPPAGAAQRQELESQVRDELQHAGPAPRFHHLADLQATTLARAVAAAGGDVLITTAVLSLTEQQRLADLLGQVHCDLLLLK